MILRIFAKRKSRLVTFKGPGIQRYVLRDLVSSAFSILLLIPSFPQSTTPVEL